MRELQKENSYATILIGKWELSYQFNKCFLKINNSKKMMIKVEINNKNKGNKMLEFLNLKYNV